MGGKAFGVAAADTPKIGDWCVIPKSFAKAHFVKFGDTNAGGIWFGVFREDIHSNFSEKHIGTDAGGGGNAGFIFDFSDDFSDEFGG